MTDRRSQDKQAHIDRAVKDAQVERGKHESFWDQNHRLAVGAHKGAFQRGGTTKQGYFVVNRIQNSIVVQTGIETEQNIRPMFIPRETNEPPTVFLRPESRGKFIQFAEDFALTPNMLMGVEPVPIETFGALAAESVEQPQPNPNAGRSTGSSNTEVQPDEIMVPVRVFSDDDFILVTDELAAEALTQEHTSQWESAGCDEDIRTNIWNKNEIGHSSILVQWNPQEARFEFTNLYPYHAWIDRWANSTRNANNFVIRQVLDLAEAKRDFPEFSSELTEQCGDGYQTSEYVGAMGDKFGDVGERPVVCRHTMWERDHPYPMDVDEAIDKGLVKQAIAEPTLDAATNTVVDMGGPITDEQGQPMYVTSEGVSTVPGDDAWPVRYGIRQLDMIGDLVLYDGETEFADIPVGWNKNIPISESPYGQGEPQRLQDLQDLMNRLYGIYYDHAKFYRSPEQILPKSVLDMLKTEMSTLHAHAGRKIGIDDDMWDRFQGNLIQDVTVPQLTSVFGEMMSMVSREMDVLSGTGDVLRGEAKSEWSGELFEQATNAARGPVGFKARHTAEMLRYISRITAQLIIDFLPLDEWSKRNSKYPPQILQAMRSRLKRVGFDVSVQVGGATSKDRKAGQLKDLLHQNPVFANSPTFMKQLGEQLEIGEMEKITQEIAALQAPPVA